MNQYIPADNVVLFVARVGMPITHDGGLFGVSCKDVLAELYPRTDDAARMQRGSQ